MISQGNPTSKISTRLLEVTLLFLKLGTISFGGPAAHIALIEQETVHKRRWLSREHFLDLLAATNLIPGPNATEMAIYIGFIYAGWLGLIASGVAFILPAFAISLVLSWIYVYCGSLPQSNAIFYGINPVVVAIILTATYRLGRSAIKDRGTLAIALASFAAALMGLDEVIILLIAGCIGMLLYLTPRWFKRTGTLALILCTHLYSTFRTNLLPNIDGRLWKLGLFFLKVGSLIFGSGMVLFAFIQKDVVTRYGWLTQRELMDAIAVGQMTPGPVLSSATFIGYLVAGWQGAIISTVAIFLPSFIIVALMGPLIPRLRRSPTTQAFLRGVNAAVVALILFVSISFFRSAVIDLWTLLIFVCGMALLIYTHVDTGLLVIGGGIVGLIHYLTLNIVK